MAAKGSRKNPYTWNEYTTKVTSNTWQGGWVASSGELNYRSYTLEIYTGCCAKSNPVPETFFNEMTQREIWLGGWVRTNSNETKYYDSNSINRGSSLGEISDPCPMSIYIEMISNGIWEGGWIQESNGMFRYVPNLNLIIDLGGGSGNGHGSSSGSDSGSAPDGGSGSGYGELEALGCSINAGSCMIGNVMNGNQKMGELHAIWTEGKTIGQNELSVVTFSMISQKPTDVFNINGLYAVWVNAYEMSIGGSFTYTGNNEPTRLFHINTSFVIPESYRQYD